MDINSLQGANAYMANRPPVENTQIQDQNREAAETSLNRENALVIQEAFEVNITQEASAAAQTNPGEQPDRTLSGQPPQPGDQTQDRSNRQPGNSIVDIVA